MSSEMMPRRRRSSIGTRLTLWGAGLTTLLITLVSAFLYAAIDISMRAQIDSFLEGEIHEFMLLVQEHPNDDAYLAAYFQEELGVRKRNDLGFRLIDVNGSVFVSSAAHDVLAGHWTAPASWYTEAPHVLCETMQPPAAMYAYRVCSFRTETGDGRACTAQSSYLLDQMTASLARIRRVAAVILFVAPFVAVGLGGFLARRSLRPVREIIRCARGIGVYDLRSRVPLSGSGDEMDQLAETLNGTLDRLEATVREIQRFTADAAHELRTPLTALRGTAELALLRERSPEELRQTIAESIAQYERLQRIADDLLLLARIDAQEAILRNEPISLDTVVEDVRDLYAPIAEDKGLVLEVGNPGGAIVHGDGGRLRQVLGNLLDNAIKYTPAPGRVTVSVTRGRGAATIMVTDTGVGIPAADLPRVFDRFYRADPARSTSSSRGSGLGLSICRSIVEAHGGTIGIDSTPGKGTAVCVTLPCRDGHSDSRDSIRSASAGKVHK